MMIFQSAEESGREADDVPDWIRKASCEEGATDIEHQICLRCGRRRTTTEKCGEKDTKVELEPSALWERTGRVHEDACDHEWLTTGSMSYMSGGHGHRHISVDVGTVRYFGDHPPAVEGMVEYAAGHDVSPFEIFNKLVRYAETKDETYERPFEKDPTRQQTVEWLEQNMGKVEERIETWSPAKGQKKTKADSSR